MPEDKQQAVEQHFSREWNTEDEEGGDAQAAWAAGNPLQANWDPTFSFDACYDAGWRPGGDEDLSGGEEPLESGEGNECGEDEDKPPKPLSQRTQFGGWAAKHRPGEFESISRGMAPAFSQEGRLGLVEGEEGVAVHINEDQATVFSLDWFPPAVDDPYMVGAISAAGALSNVYAAGVKPMTALNVMALPCNLGLDSVGAVMHGGSDKVIEAGAFVVGGHSIDSADPKYGLAVFGVAHPSKIIRNERACAGDVLFYTKPLGSGVLIEAFRKESAQESEIAECEEAMQESEIAECEQGPQESEVAECEQGPQESELTESMREAVDSMMELNKAAFEAWEGLDVHAAATVAGMGLAGTLHELLQSCTAAAELSWENIGLLADAREHCENGLVSQRCLDVAAWAAAFMDFEGADEAEAALRMKLLCDPQTSGGLLVALPEAQAQAYAAAFEALAGRPPARVGRIVAGETGRIRVL